MKRYKCDCCLKESENNIGWMFYNFKFLKPAWVCQECRPQWKDHMVKLQEKGL